MYVYCMVAIPCVIIIGLHPFTLLMMTQDAAGARVTLKVRLGRFKVVSNQL